MKIEAVGSREVKIWTRRWNALRLSTARVTLQLQREQHLLRQRKKSLCKNQDDLNALFATCKNSVHVAACIMCRDQMQTLCRIIFTVLSPIRLEHGVTAQVARGPDAIRKWYLGAATCRAWAVLEECCATLQSSVSLASMGFTVDFGRGLPGGISIAHDLVKDEDDKAERAMGLWLRVSYHRTESMMWHFASWVGLFALAASDDDQYVDNCISTLKAHH